MSVFQNAYTATAINSTNFCTSARDAFVILVENALRVAAINTVGDFVLFLGKVNLFFPSFCEMVINPFLHQSDRPSCCRLGPPRC